MKRPVENSEQEVIAGLVERATFHSLESGSCVLCLKARGHRDFVTTIGHAAMISAGEWVTASSEWVNDSTHGLQFRARFLKTSAPTSLDGIEKYLGSSMIRGIGPVYAKRMVKMFGKDVFDLIEAEPARLEWGYADPPKAYFPRAYPSNPIIHYRKSKNCGAGRPRLHQPA
ncbi:helix-hairpin-helix domain-containing protein [Sulfitobacter sp. SK012]|uniref:helix-hairpin-helix domain-containing protein n=1 Tax=Sulfitobacter sp. SK012 TaxID=1389005 RepID=UPI0020C80BBC|nr:helix-hairpin-helix domain-containing protein [Sulfitobacter sp. SK012]